MADGSELESNLVHWTPEAIRGRILTRTHRGPGEARKTGVYFVHCAATGLTKIGVSAASLRHRLENLRTMCPTELELLRVIRGGHLIERVMHSAFRDRHSHGEWFHVTREEVASVDARAAHSIADDLHDAGALGRVWSNRRTQNRQRGVMPGSLNGPMDWRAGRE